jgi:hypothetical protein
VHRCAPLSEALPQLAASELQPLLVWRNGRLVGLLAGELDEAMADIQTLLARVDDLTDSGRGEIAEQLRPFYLEYLRREGVQSECRSPRRA